ncbi:uncharacterized protein LOC106652859 [Trichogramma pretiosum]|uniref:uncharacterized protein LOC106652859 n=1 Tax=Trichogramma pretiosum TaxID=7493 RepID=UPI0006C962D6|nr:uncharacterized protein LOC106652859 [Trichogramma pretiosum]XP_014227499.1 uncharacterized protein LOC106652859 [Trichogramma pretiosum]
MLQNYISSRFTKRALLLLLAWGLILIATVQLRQVAVSNGSNQNSVFLQSAKESQTNQQQDSELDKLLIDRRGPRSEDELVREIEERLPSLPLSYWNLYRVKQQTKPNRNETNQGGCLPRYPSIFELEFNNAYWQTLRTNNGTFQLFGAFYDVRGLSRIGPAIRIVGMIDRIEPTVRTYCQMWWENERYPRIVEILEYKYVWYKKWGNYKQGIYQPYVIACKVPQSHWHRGAPASVSLVERRCDTASNNLRVIYNRPPNDKKHDFAVCVKGLDFLHDDLSVRMVEWIELLNLLGADKIFFYELQVHPNVSKVLQHYERLGRVHVTPLTLPGHQPNVPGFQHLYLTKKTNHKRQNELIPYNDCLYKHMYEFKYIVLLDVDEVIMPVRDATWRELMDRVMPKALKLRNETRASYNVRNVYFLDDLLHSHGAFKDIPSWAHMLQHVFRSKNFTKPNQYIKCFHNPERVVTLHNHFPLACLGAGCTSYPIDTTDAQLQHYRADCVKSLKKSCVEYRENSVLDTTIWRYKDQLIPRVNSTLRNLGFFGPVS